MTNNVTDRYYDWPMNQVQFAEYLEDKYSNPDGIHHYEVTKDSGRTTGQGPNDYSHIVEVNSDTANASAYQIESMKKENKIKKDQFRLLNQTF